MFVQDSKGCVFCNTSSLCKLLQKKKKKKKKERKKKKRKRKKEKKKQCTSTPQ